MKKGVILLVDSIINFLLGLLLLFYPRVIIEFIGIPLVGNAFYPSILGSVLLGIAIALFLEWRRNKSEFIGLGIGGAIVINFCAAVALVAWLLFGNLGIQLKGYIIMWFLALLIVAIAVIEVSGVKGL
jgi:hypothetical protein